MFFLQCDYTSRDELEKSGIRDAYHVIIYSTQGMVDKGMTGDQEWMSERKQKANDERFKGQLGDKNSLLLVNILESFFPEVKYSFELLGDSQFKFLYPKPTRQFWNLSLQFYPKFYAGEVLLETLLIRATSQLPIYNTNLEIIESLLSTKIVGLNNKEKRLTSKILMEFNEKNCAYKTGDKSEYEHQAYDHFIENKLIYTIDIPTYYLMKYWYQFYND
jgi:hypothetical protein